MRAALCVLMLLGCGGGESQETPDAFQSDCGRPGDTGNELGIGKFCASQSECTNPDAPLCSSIGDRNTHFCTRTCPMGSTDRCGTGAECTCDNLNRCGCTPTVCLGT